MHFKTVNLTLQVNNWTFSVSQRLFVLSQWGLGCTNKTCDLCELSICRKASSPLINSYSLSSLKLWGLFLLSDSAPWQSLPAVLILIFLWSESLHSICLRSPRVVAAHRICSKLIEIQMKLRKICLRYSIYSNLDKGTWYKIYERTFCTPPVL